MAILETLIVTALLIAELLYVGYVILITIEEIVNWFKRVTNKTPQDVGFTITDALASGDYKLVQGVFNQDTGKVTEGRRMDVKSLDSTLQDYHRNHKVVIYS